MTSILGTKPAPDDGLPPGAPRGRDAERILAGELLSEFRAMKQTMTEFAERLAGRLVNHVLLVKTVTFDAAGNPIPLSWGSAAGSIEIQTGANPVWVQSGTAGSSAPTGGVGVYKVPGNTKTTVAVAAYEVTLWGTAADTISVQVFTSAITPVS